MGLRAAFSKRRQYGNEVLFRVLVNNSAWSISVRLAHHAPLAEDDARWKVKAVYRMEHTLRTLPC